MYFTAIIKFEMQNDQREVSHKYPNVALRWSTDEAVLSRVDSQGFDRRVVGLEALPLVPVRKLQDADPALPPACDKQLLPGGHWQHSSTGLVAAESWGDRENIRISEDSKMNKSEGTEQNWEKH